MEAGQHNRSQMKGPERLPCLTVTGSVQGLGESIEVQWLRTHRTCGQSISQFHLVVLVRMLNIDAQESLQTPSSAESLRVSCEMFDTC